MLCVFYNIKTFLKKKTSLDMHVYTYSLQLFLHQ